MDNELKILCDLLEGYNELRRFHIVSAEKREDGKWSLFVERVLTKTEEANDNNE